MLPILMFPPTDNISDTNFCPPLGFAEKVMSAELHSASPNHHQQANINQATIHRLTSHWMYFRSYLDGFLQYDSMNTVGVNP